MTKRAFLSYAHTLGDQTYWLTTGLDRHDWTFTVIPLHVFDGYKLQGRIVSNEPYAEITVFAEDVDGQHSFSSDCGKDPILLPISAESRPFLTWNEMIGLLLDKGAPLSQLLDLWHNHIVRPIDPMLQISDVDYKVTAFLPPPDHEGKFAIWGSDYVPGTNPNWLTFDFPDDESFRARLRQFKVVAVEMSPDKYYAV